MRIAFIADPESPNAWYRCVGPMMALARRGNHELRQILKVGGAFHAHLVDGCDVVHVHRQHDDRTMQVLRHAKETGIGIVWDNDDDMSAVPKGNPAYKLYGGLKGERVRAAVGRIMRIADVVSTPSARLAAIYRELGAQDVRVIENYARDEIAGMRAGSRDGRLVIGWLAGVEHHLDVERLPIRATLGRLLDAHPEVEVATIGVGLGLRHERYRHISQVDFMDLLDAMAQWDVGIAPLSGDLAFNQARSNIKVKEYAMLGMPWLASPVGAYVGLGEQQGGRLVPDDGWDEALERIVVKDRERRKLAKRALKWGKGQTVGANVGLWEDVLETARRRAGG